MTEAAGRVALLAGASGLVGRELLELLRQHAQVAAVHTLVRRAGASSSTPRVTEHVVDFGALPSLPHCDDVFIALGTTIKVAGSEAAFRRVDFDYVVAVAEAARRAGATRLGLVSALGADATSRVFYNRVKGEVEAAVTRLEYASVVIARPSLLLGDRERLGQPKRSGERWAERLLGPVSSLIPASFRPVAARDVAQQLLDVTLSAPLGVTILTSKDLHRSSERGSRRE